MGERTLSGQSNEGWFIPYRYAGAVDPAMGYPLLERQLASRHAAFADMLEIIGSYEQALLNIAVDAPAPTPRWDQDWFAGLDAAAAYAFVRHFKPKRIIEIGSGHSTRFMVRAVTDSDLSCEVTAIDPQPRADISTLPVKLYGDVVERVPLSIFDKLKAGDILFIDSSHIMMPGTDVDRLFGEIIPALPAGVLIHIHDIFLPDPYPVAWLLRGYNDQNALAPLVANSVLKPLFPCQYVSRYMAREVSRHTDFIPRPRPNHDASFWTVKA